MGFCKRPFSFFCYTVSRGGGEGRVGWVGGEGKSRRPRRCPQPAGGPIYGEGLSFSSSLLLSLAIKNNLKLDCNVPERYSKAREREVE